MCKYCKFCGLFKEDSEFAKSYNVCKQCTSYFDRLASRCKYVRARNKVSKYKYTDKTILNIESDLDDDYIELLVQGSCYYCEDTDDLGFDRIDNSKGHTKDNVIICCKHCNVARNNFYSKRHFNKVGLGIKDAKWEMVLEDLLDKVTGFYDMTWYDAINEHLGEYYYV